MSFQEYAASIDRGQKLVDKRALIGICIVVAVVLILVIPRLLDAFVPSDAQSEADEMVIEATEAEAPATSEVCAHVAGCVRAPGLVTLDEGARIADAIEAVGGFTDDADQASINLAEVIQDGAQIIVPSILEAQTAQEGAEPDGASPSSVGQKAGGKVNLNTASVSDLMQLSGIGESKAKKIVAYREANGRFSSVDELVNVSGIGEKTLEALRPDICV